MSIINLGNLSKHIETQSSHCLVSGIIDELLDDGYYDRVIIKLVETSAYPQALQDDLEDGESCKVALVIVYFE